MVRISASAAFQRLISRIDTVFSTEDLNRVALQESYSLVIGQNNRLSPEGRFQDRHTNAIIIIFLALHLSLLFHTVRRADPQQPRMRRASSTYQMRGIELPPDNGSNRRELFGTPGHDREQRISITDRLKTDYYDENG